MFSLSLSVWPHGFLSTPSARRATCQLDQCFIW